MKLQVATTLLLAAVTREQASAIEERIAGMRKNRLSSPASAGTGSEP